MLIKKVFEHRDHMMSFGLFLVAVGISCSTFLMSIGGLWMAGWFILTGHWQEKWSNLKSSGALVFLLLFTVHIIALLYSNNWEYGINDLRKKLPLLSYPLILGSWRRIPLYLLQNVLAAFVTTVILMCGVVLVRYFLMDVPDFRNLMPFVSHIRFSIAIVVAGVMLALWHFYTKKYSIVFTLVLESILLLSLILLQSLTGLVSLFLVGILLLTHFKASKLLWLLIFVPVLYMAGVTSHHYLSKDIYTTLPSETANGNPYIHNTKAKTTENGHYIWLYVCEGEMAYHWEARTGESAYLTNPDGYPIAANLIRYLTSKNLPKDSLGVWALSEEDILAVKSGATNYKNTAAIPLYDRIKEVLFEIDHYLETKDPSGHSITMRLEYAKAGWNVFLEHPIIGTGTGDVRDEMLAYYDNTNSVLKDKYRLRAHNQILTFLLTFGVVGFAIILYAFYGSIKKAKVKSVFFTAFLVTMIVSAFWEDTLESQVGVTLFTFFYAIWVCQLAPYSDANIWRYKSLVFFTIDSTEKS